MLPVDHIGERGESHISSSQLPPNSSTEDVAPSQLSRLCSECGRTKVSLPDGGCWTCHDCHGKQRKFRADLARSRLEMDEMQRQNLDQAEELKVLKVELSGSQKERRIVEEKLEELQRKVAFLQKWDLEVTTSRGELRLKAVDGSIVLAHQFVLASKSSVFKDILEASDRERQLETLEVAQMPGEVLRAFVDFLYKAEVKESVLRSFPHLLLEAAIKYNVAELKCLCMHQIYWKRAVQGPSYPHYSSESSELACETAIHLFEQAEQHNLLFLKASLLTGLMNRSDQEKLLQSAAFANLIQENAALASKIGGMLKQSEGDKCATHIREILMQSDLRSLQDWTNKRQRVG